ncbi:chromosome condensation protein CrcB [Haloarcula mannanilytica]|uniref:Fluoride-specific ion channel FluC n=1 Tax=Haloarcula mannanilytica TaxID=2509225 RepID=A0A4C2EL85_9EURY|nr:CrcB family protein [Haloarcula mannanilytica]GCF14080.1 chromosome condensation protein CrcB [Haloarcula mannanilytica]
MKETHPLASVETIVLVGLGGFAGSNLRYFVGLFFPGLQGTLLVNVLGSFALGVLVYEGLQVGTLASETKLAASTGFISSFTTYSTFAVETVLTPKWAVANIVGSYALGFAGVLAGRTVVRLLTGGEG